MALQWDESLVFGHDEIDNQHRSIFDYFHKLSVVISQGMSKDLVGEMANFLFDYSHEHFEAEENIMIKYGYPQLEAQRQEHYKFMIDTGKIKKQVEEEGVSREIAIKACSKLFRWYFQHIKQHDKKMIQYVKEHM